MEYSAPLTKAKLVKRYKRFLADVILENGEEVTVHCPNTGSMATCGEPGDQIALSRSSNPKRKYAYTWELTACQGGYIGINTMRSNQIVGEALRQRAIPELADYDQCQPEVRFGSQSRLDFLLSKSADHKDHCFVEVKNVSLLGSSSQALFPDAVTSRGQKHLSDLGDIAASGVRAVLLFLVNRPDVTTVSLAHKIDPEYARRLTASVDKGLEVLCYQTANSLTQTVLTKRLAFQFS